LPKYKKTAGGRQIEGGTILDAASLWFFKGAGFDFSFLRVPHPCGIVLGKGGPCFTESASEWAAANVANAWAGGQFDFVEDKRESRCLLVQDNTEEGRVDVETVIVVFNEAEFPEFVHEKIHPRPRGPNHFSEHLL